MGITTEQIKDLRDKTGISVMQCKKALEEAGGDTEGALRVLRREGALIARKKADRALKAGVVQAYVHGTKRVGALVLLSSETDFVAKNDEFAALAYDIAMHIAAMGDDGITREKLLEQPFIKDEGKSIGMLIDEAMQKFGERIEITEFSRLKVE
jgi:elongation factor Ts